MGRGGGNLKVTSRPACHSPQLYASCLRQRGRAGTGQRSMARAGQERCQQRDSKPVRVRQATDKDIPAVAALCAEVFGPLTLDGLPKLLRVTGGQSQHLNFEVAKDVEEQLQRSFQAKLKAQKEARIVNLQLTNTRMTTELARLAGGPSSASITASTPFQRQNNNWGNRRRKFAVLVATMPLGPERVVGCIVLSIAAPQALLPAPWPSRASLQCCVSNLAVAPLQRRQGIASKLLGSSEKLARRWGHQDLWLHSEVKNRAARELYSSIGYKEVKRDPGFFGPFQRILYRRHFASRMRKLARETTLAGLNAGSVSDRVYQWNVSDKSEL